jgi:cytochrome c oxidase subunit IV
MARRKRMLMVVKAIGIWGLFLIFAMINGGLRDAVIMPLAGEQIAHIIGSIVFALIIFLITLALIRFIGVKGTADAWAIGTLWLGMTVSFEFLFFHYVMGTPWDRLLADYNILKGRLWLFVLVSTLLSPVIAARIKQIGG